MAQDLKALTPEGDKDGLFIAERKSAKGIHCRFGMRGVVAVSLCLTFVRVMRSFPSFRVCSLFGCVAFLSYFFCL